MPRPAHTVRNRVDCSWLERTSRHSLPAAGPSPSPFSARSEAVRRGLIEAAQRLRDRRRLAGEAAALADDPASFRPEIEIDGTVSRVLVEQTGAVDVTRLGDYHGHLSASERWGVDLALQTVLDLQ